MKKALRAIADRWAKYRVVVAFFGLIMVGALFAWALAAWYFQARLENQYQAMNDHIEQLKAAGDHERFVTQNNLRDFGIEFTARLDDIAERLERLTPQVQQAGETAGEAARQAGSAAEQAAKASIRIREIRNHESNTP